MDLTDRQKALLTALHETPATTSGRVGERLGMTENAARKALVRLAERGLVLRNAEDEGSTWELTRAGAEIVAPTPRRESGDSSGRPYTVLEQTTLVELVRRHAPAATAEGIVELLDGKAFEQEVYVIAGQVPARNTEHAFRRVAKDVYATREVNGDVVTVPSVAIDGKRWKVVPVRIKAEPTVTIG